MVRITQAQAVKLAALYGRDAAAAAERGDVAGALQLQRVADQYAAMAATGNGGWRAL